jgi:PBP1b-binding outer membrane lipoprotein LpoB
MKKLTIITALTFTSIFFASCESSEIAPAQTAEKPAKGNYQEPEFRNTTRNINTETPTISEVLTEIPAAIKPANVVAE